MLNHLTIGKLLSVRSGRTIHMLQTRINNGAIRKLVHEILDRSLLFGVPVPDGYNLAELVIETAVYRAIRGVVAFTRLIIDLADIEPTSNAIQISVALAREPAA
jgi:hypothetical protein